MPNVFDNLKLLKLDMERKGWVIDSFYFHYKNQNYIVLVKLFDEKEIKPKYALVKIEFLKENDFSDCLSIEANSRTLIVDAKTLRKYFDIEYGENWGDIIDLFNHQLARFIPIEVSENITKSQMSAIISSLNKSDSKDPNRIYCYEVKRNPTKQDGTLGQRSPYNDNKTRLLRPTLYALLGNDTNLSFRYSINPQDENSDEIIVQNWTRNQNK